MKNINVTLRMDDELKKQADALFLDLGLNLSAAVNLFIRQSIREQRIPFQITRNIPNATTISAMEKAEEGKDLFGPFDNIEDLMGALNA